MGSSGEALTSERLSDRRLREINEAIEADDCAYPPAATDAIWALLFEVERQRAALAAAAAREAALVKRLDKAMRIVQMVANRWPLFSTDRVDELVKQARALLASAASEQVETFVCPGCGGHWRKDQLGPTPDILRCPNCGEVCERSDGDGQRGA